MKKQVLNRFAFVVGIALIAGIISTPASYFSAIFGDESAFVSKMESLKITLGLDLAGGTELDYKIDLSDAIAQNSDDDPINDVNVEQIAESVRDALEARVNPAGVGEVLVKRSQVNEEEHILIQLPPSSNVEKAKRDAEKDNRLEFFEEDPDLEKKMRIQIAAELAQTNPSNWNMKVAGLTQDENVSHEVIDYRFRDSFPDPILADKLLAARSGTILQEIIETQTEVAYEMDDEGKLNITSFPRPVLAIVHLTGKREQGREKDIPKSAQARHILFGYEGALRAPEDAEYKTKEEAKEAAEKVLAEIKGGGDFAELAKEYSTGPSADKGGDLGEFNPGSMVPAFDAAVFGKDAVLDDDGNETTPAVPAAEIGLVADLVETDFGFHIIEVLEQNPEKTENYIDTQLKYEMIAWDKNELFWQPTQLGGAQLENASVGYDQVGQPLVNLLFDAEGGDLFAELTGRVASKKGQCDGGVCRLGIKVGGNWITTPTVREQIFGRQSQITGNFTFQSAHQLANDLNLGAIDAPVILSGQTTIQPELGAEQLAKSLKAAAFGLLATMIFMTFGYRLAGLVASVALILYTGIFVSILKTWPESFGGPIVLTLAGMAGIALSIGLAVDGNILIFERMKEEFVKRKDLNQAVDLGFERAWTAIRDSNLTTLLTCVILFSMGSSIVKGFAITLIVGTILSMFTAITISRNLLRFVLIFDCFHKPWLFGISGKFVKKSEKKLGGKIRRR